MARSDEGDDDDFDREEIRRALENSVAAATSTASSKTTEPKKKRKTKRKKRRTKRKRSPSPHDDDDDDDDGGGGKMPAKKSSTHREDTADTNKTLIRILTLFGHCYEYENPSSDATATAGDVKQWLVRDQPTRAEHEDFINFYHSQTRQPLEDSDAIEYDIHGLCTLFVVFGTDARQTGTIGEHDIYAPTLQNKLPQPVVPAAAAASVAGIGASNAATGAKMEVSIPSTFEVTGMYTHDEGYCRTDNLTTFSAPIGSQVFYIQRFLITPELLQFIREVENGGNELANLLCCTKIGESESPGDGFDKFGNKRTGICFARQHFVMFIHRVNSFDIETCLHARYALKQGDAHGEFYADITDLECFELIEHFKHYPDMIILFGMTKVQNLRDYNTESSGEGFVYRARPTWNQRQLSVIDTMQRNHPNHDSSMPFLPTITCNTNDFRNAIRAVKFGTTQLGSVEEVGSYVGNKLLWSNGMVPSGAFNCIQRDDAGEDEKLLHNDLRPFHIVGEWFREDATSTLEGFGGLFGDEIHTFSRTRDHFWISKNALRRSIGVYGIMTHRLVWEHIKYGSMIYFPNGRPSRKHDELNSDIVREVLQFMDPSDKYPLRRSEIIALIRLHLAAYDHKKMDDTALSKHYDTACDEIRCVKVNLGNRTSFRGIEDDEALEAFIGIFGQESRSIAESFM